MFTTSGLCFSYSVETLFLNFVSRWSFFNSGFFFQDMSRQPPTQELVAKDLHANEWRFRHIFRGIGIRMSRIISYFVFLDSFV